LGGQQAQNFLGLARTAKGLHIQPPGRGVLHEVWRQVPHPGQQLLGLLMGAALLKKAVQKPEGRFVMSCIEQSL
jgi:hypothetical protein